MYYYPREQKIQGEKSAISTREVPNPPNRTPLTPLLFFLKVPSGRVGPKTAESLGTELGAFYLSCVLAHTPFTLKYPWACPVSYESAGEQWGRAGKGNPLVPGRSP